MNDHTQTVMAAERAASAATYVGSGIAGGSGLVFGLTASEWSVIGVIGGLFFAAVGYATSTYFQWRRTRMLEKRLAAGQLPASVESDAAPLGPK
jgi:hypothetical protein